MAKLKAPLFSLGASGSIAKTLVYFSWKGINAVREHVVPTNPKTGPQQAQRAYMTAALAEFHSAAYNELDMTAWARLAGAEGLIMTGFNRMVKEFIDESVAGNTWQSMYRVWVQTITDTTLRIRWQKAAAGNTPTLRYGVRKTYFPDTQAAEDMGGGYWVADVTGLTASTLYYFTIDVGTSGTDWGRVGIYMARTTA